MRESEVKVSRYHLMSDSAKEYYERALNAHRIYANQLEMYLGALILMRA